MGFCLVSRERDSLAADLEAYLEIISNSHRDLASVAETSGWFPAWCRRCPFLTSPFAPRRTVR